MDAAHLARTAGGVADHPAHRVAGGDGGQGFTRLKRDVADPLGRGIEAVERALRKGIDMDGIDIAVGVGLLERRLVGGVDLHCRRPLVGPAPCR